LVLASTTLRICGPTAADAPAAQHRVSARARRAGGARRAAGPVCTCTQRPIPAPMAPDRRVRDHVRRRLTPVRPAAYPAVHAGGMQPTVACASRPGWAGQYELRVFVGCPPRT
jgi:hypothetical protein